MNEQTIWRRSFQLFGPLSLSTMAGMSIGAALFLAGSLWALAKGWRTWGREALREAWLNPWGLATVLFFAACFLSLLAAWIFPPLGRSVGGFSELKKFHHFLYPPFIALALLRTSPGGAPGRHPFWKIWAGMGVFLFFVAVAQFFARDLFPEAWLSARFFRAAGSSGRFHGQGLMFFHLSFAACMSFVASAGFARSLWPCLSERGWVRAAWAAVGVAGAGAVYFSFSRAGLFGLCALVCTLGFLRRPLWGLGAVLACALIASGLWFSVPSLRQRFNEAASYNSERIIMWETAWEMFKERPLLGVGFGRTGEYSPAFSERVIGHRAAFTSHAHNNVLDIMGATGALGLAAFLGWWGVLFAWAARALRTANPSDRWLAAAALASFVAFHVNGLTQVNFWDGKSQHTMMLWAGVVLALELRRRNGAAAVGEGPVHEGSARAFTSK